MAGPGVPELFDIDSFEGAIWVMDTDLLRGNGTRQFIVCPRF